MTTQQETTKTSAPRMLAKLRPLSPLLPYAGVIAGMYAFGSGWTAIVSYHLAIFAVLVIYRGWTVGPTLVLGWSTATGLVMASTCVVSGGLIYFLWPLIHREGITMKSGLAGVGLEGWAWIAFIAYYSLVNPWLEELFWRGWYPSQVRQPFLSDILFAGYHVLVLLLFVQPVWTVLAFVVLLGAAWVWRLLARRFEGLLVPVVSHLVADVSVIVAAAILAAR